VVATCVLVLPLLYATDSLPRVPVMMAYVAALPATPPPPPPPPPPTRRTESARPTPTATSGNPAAAPIDAPAEIKPESVAPAEGGGQPGGVEGGIEGGVAGGIVGGLLAEAAPPPPPPPPPAAPPRQPVRIGGQVIAPALVHRVEPEYPAIAVQAQMEGLVILEATVDIDGRVTEVKVLRSRKFLDKAAIEAVQQWRYAPLMLNGVPTPFVLVVTMNFALQQQRSQNIG
jgi:protein TonB